MSENPTILLVAQHGAAARYFLRTEVLPTLLEGGARVVVLTPNADEPYLAAELAPRGVALEPLRTPPPRPGRARWAASYVLFRLRRYGVAEGHRMRAFRNKYDGFRAQAVGRNRLVTGAIHAGVVVLWRSRLLRRAVLAAELRAHRSDAHADVFARHDPDLVVAGSPGIFPADARVLDEARRRGIRTAAVILGWDNPTSKGYRGADPDEVIVWSERMAEQMETFHDIPRARAFVGGVPMFDPYLRDDLAMGRAALFMHHQLDPSRRLVVFATSSPTLWDRNEAIAERLAQAIERGELGSDAQLVVRVHPNYLRPGEHPIDAYRDLAARYAHVRVDVPDVRSQMLRIDRSDEDGRRMSALFKHADVLVNVYSTTTLEAFIADTPVVLVSEHVGESTAGKGWEDFDHLRALARHGAAERAHSLDDVVAKARKALADPHANAAARRQVAEEECGALDGLAGRRVGGHLLALAGVRAPAPRSTVAA